MHSLHLPVMQVPKAPFTMGLTLNRESSRSPFVQFRQGAGHPRELANSLFATVAAYSPESFRPFASRFLNCVASAIVVKVVFSIGPW
jgi:hypothetical protein